MEGKRCRVGGAEEGVIRGRMRGRMWCRGFWGSGGVDFLY